MMIKGNISNGKIAIDSKIFLKLFDLDPKLLSDKKIHIETDNNFKFEINNSKIENYLVNSEINLDKLELNKEIQDVLYLKNIEGKNLVNAIYLCKDVIAPESGITHIGSFLNKNTLALMHFNFINKSDIFRQIIACKEWAPLSNFKFTILKKDYLKSINKLSKLM